MYDGLEVGCALLDLILYSVYIRRCWASKDVRSAVARGAECAVCDRGCLFVLAAACRGKDIIRLSLKRKGQDITRQSSVPVGVYSRMMDRADLQSAFKRTTCARGGDMN